VIVATLSPQHLARWMTIRFLVYDGVLEDGPERVELVVPQPQVAEAYYAACAQIERHNRFYVGRPGLGKESRYS
jgi:hypothetical protein